jgi:hypothetical protein
VTLGTVVVVVVVVVGTVVGGGISCVTREVAKTSMRTIVRSANNQPASVPDDRDD